MLVALNRQRTLLGLRMNTSDTLTALTSFFDDLAPRWDAMMPPERDAHLARLLEPYAALPHHQPRHYVEDMILLRLR